MNRRPRLLLVAAGILLALNLWNWWPKTSRSLRNPENIAESRSLRAEDYVIHGVPHGKLLSATRDIFQPKRPIVVKPPPPKKPPEPPPKTPEELEHEASLVEFSQLRCLGIAFRSNQGRAMLSSGQQTFHVGVNERVGQRFIIQRIDPDGVHVLDPNTGVGGKISLSGVQ